MYIRIVLYKYIFIYVHMYILTGDFDAQPGWRPGQAEKANPLKLAGQQLHPQRIAT